ncbi:helix-turn-helix transcriptional regulator [uncultured Flavobacterium sp.]|uniref:helix-turn-helix transcriptional regulator n=1 Tax=uncultured Flavobacterium sp. TaxID=165435 RepID=UPI002604CBDC|nr:helix-turn-helix transcriptional regulator [uncultured Flavobacterium sp.]
MTVLIIIFLIVVSYYIVDKYKKKSKIQQLKLIQLEQEKEWHQNTKKLLEEKLKIESELVEMKERELTALQLKKFQIKSRLVDFFKSNQLIQDNKLIDKIIKNVDSYFDNEDYWNEFQIKFTNMHPNFIKVVKQDYPNLTKKDIDFLILIKLNLSNKEIASLISISYESVLSKKYLLRKKMNMCTDNELVVYLEGI